MVYIDRATDYGSSRSPLWRPAHGLGGNMGAEYETVEMAVARIDAAADAVVAAEGALRAAREAYARAADAADGPAIIDAATVVKRATAAYAAARDAYFSACDDGL